MVTPGSIFFSPLARAKLKILQLRNKDKNTSYTYKRNIVSIHSRKALVTVQRLRYRSVASLSELENMAWVDRRGTHENSRKNLADTYTGMLTKSSAKNLQRCTDIFFMGRKPSHGLNPVTKKEGYLQAAFITLTIPDLHTIIDAKYGYEKFLKKFMQRIIYNFGVRDYIWKFEEQERGQAHWHIFVDRFCPMDQLKKFWIQYLDEEGLANDFREKYGKDPKQSCHVVGMKNEGMLKWYLNEYFLKKNQNENATRGHIWGAAAHIKKSKLPVLPITLKFLDNVDKAVEEKRAVVKDIELPMIGEHGLVQRNPDGTEKTWWVCSIIRGNKLKVQSLLCPEQKTVYDQFITAYRQADWKKTHDLCYSEADIRDHYERWRREREGGMAWRNEAINRLRGHPSGESPPV